MSLNEKFDIINTKSLNENSDVINTKLFDEKSGIVIELKYIIDTFNQPRYYDKECSLEYINNCVIKLQSRLDLSNYDENDVKDTMTKLSYIFERIHSAFKKFVTKEKEKYTGYINNKVNKIVETYEDIFNKSAITLEKSFMNDDFCVTVNKMLTTTPICISDLMCKFVVTNISIEKIKEYFATNGKCDLSECIQYKLEKCNHEYYKENKNHILDLVDKELLKYKSEYVKIKIKLLKELSVNSAKLDIKTLRMIYKNNPEIKMLYFCITNESCTISYCAPIDALTFLFAKIINKLHYLKNAMQKLIILDDTTIWVNQSINKIINCKLPSGGEIQFNNHNFTDAFIIKELFKVCVSMDACGEPVNIVTYNKLETK